MGDVLTRRDVSTLLDVLKDTEHEGTALWYKLESLMIIFDEMPDEQQMIYLRFKNWY